MSLESELYARLSGYTDLTDIISTRIYPGKLQQNSGFPAICYQRISTVRHAAFAGDTGDIRARVQIDVWAEEYGETGGAIDVAGEVRAALQRWSGSNIQEIFLDNEQHLYEEDPELWRIIMDFTIWFKE